MPGAPSLRVLRVSAVNNTSTAATPRAQRGEAPRSHGRLDGAAPVAARGRRVQCGRPGQGSTSLRTAMMLNLHIPERPWVAPAGLHPDRSRCDMNSAHDTMPLATSNSALRIAPPAAPRMVLCDSATMRRSSTGQARTRPTLALIPRPASRSRRGWGRSPRR